MAHRPPTPADFGVLIALAMAWTTAAVLCLIVPAWVVGTGGVAVILYALFVPTPTDPE